MGKPETTVLPAADVVKPFTMSLIVYSLYT